MIIPIRGITHKGVTFDSSADSCLIYT